MTVVKTKTRKSFGLVDLLKFYIGSLIFARFFLFMINTHSAYDVMSFTIERWLDHADVHSG